MKKIYLILISFAGYIYSPAQEVLQGGNMEDESAWTITDLSGNGLDPVTITFNYTADKPTGGKVGCLSIAGFGQTRNFIYQKVSLTKGHTYLIRGLLKDGSDTTNLISNYWVEVNLVKKEPIIENFNGTGTSADFGVDNYDFGMGMHYWKTIGAIHYDRLTGYDGTIQGTLPLTWIHGSGTADSIITNPRDTAWQVIHPGDSAKFTLPDTVSTTDWYFLIKAGAFMTAGATEPSYNWLIDELSLWDLAQPITGISQIAKEMNKFDIYPNPNNGIVNIKSNASNQIGYSVYNTLGMLVKSGLTNGNINLSGLSKGFYVLSLENGHSAEQYKILLK